MLDARWYIRKGYIEGRGLQDLEKGDNKLQRLLHQPSYEDAVRLWPAVHTQSYLFNRVNGEIGL